MRAGSVVALRPAELAPLFNAAIDRDAATFKAMRVEHAGKRERGTTRYEAIAPFTARVLLTGTHFAEPVTLTWELVGLDALDHDDKKVGEIDSSCVTKTKRARTSGFEVFPPYAQC